MVRSLALACAALVILPCSSLAFADIHDSAPADEYFGPFKESILEIKNRLSAFEREADSELLISGRIRDIDNVENAIEDWDRHYPRDPWLAGFIDRMLHVYGRAHALGTLGANHCLDMLEVGFPHSAQTKDAVAYVDYMKRARR
jgi:hypothetical protein